MKLSKEASKMFAEYQRAEEAGEQPSYLSPDRLDDSFAAIRRINATTDEIYGQIVCSILKQNNIKLQYAWSLSLSKAYHLFDSFTNPLMRPSENLGETLVCLGTAVSES